MMKVAVPLKISTHLERVSRSFAFCIARLETPLRDQVGLAYLICRLLDTVEDAVWDNHQSQLESFRTFLEILDQPNSEIVQLWRQQIVAHTTGVPTGEIALLEEAELVFRDLHQSSAEVRDVLIPPIRSMARGMAGFAESRTANDGRLRLTSIVDVNRYCFFVAGVVGEILDGLLKLQAASRGVNVSSSLFEAFRFGLFLQKVNLLKDQTGDQVDGRDLVPNRNELFRSALDDSRSALRYVQSIPVEFESYRLFCSWSLFLGLASLPHILKGDRIGRIETALLLAEVESKIGSNVRLEELFSHKQEPLEKEFRPGFHGVAKDVATELYLRHYILHYEGRAKSEELRKIANLS